MILDKTTMFADALAFDGVAAELDLDTVRPGPGQPIKCFLTGSADLAGCTGFTISHSATATADTLHVTQVGNPAGAMVEFELPSDILRYTTVALTGTVTAGSWSCGVILPGAQSAK